MIAILIITILTSVFVSINSEKIANLFLLKDSPEKSKRKIHISATPYTGGIAILLTIIIVYIFNLIEFSFKKELLANYLLCVSFFVIGFLDDKLDIKPLHKIILYSLTTYFFINVNQELIINNVYSETFDRYFFTNNLNIFFTILCFLILQNALNMIDGIDGLLLFFAAKVLIIIFFINFNFLYIIIALNLLIISLFNLRKKLFLGNNGSSIISAILAISIIETYNRHSIDFSAEKIFILLIIPGLDMLRLFITRILNKKNPFEADNNHLHHYLIKKNSHIISSLLIVFSSLIIFILSLYINNILLIITSSVLYFIFLLKLSRNK